MRNFIHSFYSRKQLHGQILRLLRRREPESLPKTVRCREATGRLKRPWTGFSCKHSLVGSAA